MEIEKVKQSIAIMKKAYDTYRDNARKNLEADNSEMYWHWQKVQGGVGNC